MAYTPHVPAPAETPEQLRTRVPGWGVDLDHADRPSYPKLDFRDDLSGAHWQFPERQPETSPRERSLEHKFLTPVFGTAQPTRGVSGALRRYSYARFSEARAAHWLILLAADRVDSVGAHVRSLGTLRPDNPLTETGVRSELTHHGLSSRRGRKDVRHHVLDPLIVAGPWLVALGATATAARALGRALSR